MDPFRGGPDVARKTFSEEQIVYALRQAEGGTPVVEVCRRLGVSEQTFYRWKRKFAAWTSGAGVSDPVASRRALHPDRVVR